MKNHIIVPFVLLILFNFKLKGQEASIRAKTLSALLREREIFSVTGIHHSGYNYNFSGDEQDALAQIKRSYTLRLSGKAPVYISRNKRLISLMNLDVYRTWFDVGDVSLNPYSEELDNQYTQKVHINDYLSITPSIMYRFKVFNKSAYLINRFTIYGQKPSMMDKLSMNLMINLTVYDRIDATFGIGAGIMYVNANQIIGFPVITYNQKIRHNMYINSMLPYKLQISYFTTEKLRFFAGTGMDTYIHIFRPRTGDISNLRLNDLGIFSHLTAKYQLLKFIGIKGKVGYRSVFRSQFSNLRNGDDVSESELYNHLAIELGLSFTP